MVVGDSLNTLRRIPSALKEVKKQMLCTRVDIKISSVNTTDRPNPSVQSYFLKHVKAYETVGSQKLDFFMRAPLPGNAGCENSVNWSVERDASSSVLLLSLQSNAIFFSF